MKVRVTNIQRFSLQDGPGIRTTVFFKGCSIRCPWCSNPENLKPEIEEYDGGIFGLDIELEELEKEILKDKKYYKTGGGVTFSGGEPLLQFKRIEKLLENLKKQNINICVETSLYVPEELVGIALKYVDEFIVDLKILDKKQAKEILKGNVEQYYLNIEKLFENNVNIKLRIPVTKEYTLKHENKKLLLQLIEKYKPKDIEIFKIHRLGEKKYKVLNKQMPQFEDVSDEELQEFLQEIVKLGVESAKICKI